MVDKTSFLDPNNWLGIENGLHAPELLKARLITKKELLDNANWVYRQANQLGEFDGGGQQWPAI